MASGLEFAFPFQAPSEGLMTGGLSLCGEVNVTRVAARRRARDADPPAPTSRRGQGSQRMNENPLKDFRKSVTSTATASGLFACRALAMSLASVGMSPGRMPRLTISGVPNRRPFKSPATAAIGKPIPQASRFAARKRLAAVCPPPYRVASIANWCEVVAMPCGWKTGMPSDTKAIASACAVSTIDAAYPAPCSRQSSREIARAADLAASKFAVMPGKAITSRR